MIFDFFERETFGCRRGLNFNYGKWQAPELVRRSYGFPSTPSICCPLVAFSLEVLWVRFAIPTFLLTFFGIPLNFSYLYRNFILNRGSLKRQNYIFRSLLSILIFFNHKHKFCQEKTTVFRCLSSVNMSYATSKFPLGNFKRL